MEQDIAVRRVVVGIIDEVCRYIRSNNWEGLNERITQLDLTSLSPVEIVAWLRSPYPVRTRIPTYDLMVSKARSHLGGLGNKDLLRGL